MAAQLAAGGAGGAWGKGGGKGRGSGGAGSGGTPSGAGEAVAALCAHIRAQRPEAADLLAQVDALGVVPAAAPKTATAELRAVLGQVESAQRTFAQRTRALENTRKQFVAAQEAAGSAAKELAELEARASALTQRLRDAGSSGGGASAAAGPMAGPSSPLAQVMALHEAGEEVVVTDKTLPGFDHLEAADQERVTSDLRKLFASVAATVQPIKERIAAHKAECLAAQERASKKRKDESGMPVAAATDAAEGARPGADAGVHGPAAGAPAPSGGRGGAADAEARELLERARAAVRESAGDRPCP